MARRRCKRFSRAALERGARVEHREHPEFTRAQAQEIARDHLCAKGSRAYPAHGSFGSTRLPKDMMPAAQRSWIPYTIYRQSSDYLYGWQWRRDGSDEKGRGYRTKRAATEAALAHMRETSPSSFSALKRRGFKVKGWHHARGMIDVGVPRPAVCECKCEKGMHYGRGHAGECMTIGCRCTVYSPARGEQ